jgi:hypothetical protein
MKLPFLFLSVVLIPLANAQGNVYVSEYNLTYYLGEDDFTVIETLIFENQGDPFTYEGSIYFLRGDAENVKVEGFSYSVTQGYPRKINLEFMISKGQKKRVSIRYKRADLLSEEGGITTFEGLSLGKYSWPVYRARITFIIPPGYQFGSVSPATGRIQRGETETLYYDVSVFDNVSAVLDGFPVRVEYADYKGLAKRDMRALDSLLAEAEFEMERANGSLENARSYGINVSQAMGRYALSISALQDGMEKFSFSRINYEAGEYYRAYIFGKASRDSMRAAIKEAAAARELVNLEIQSLLEKKTTGSKNQSLPAETKPIETDGERGEKGLNPIYLISGLVLAALLVGAAFFISRGRTRKPQAQAFAGIKDLKRKEFKGFERKISGVKKRAEKSREIRRLIRERGVIEVELEKLHKKRARKKINKKTFEGGRKKLLKKLDEIDSRRSKLELELEKIRQETRRG